MNIFLFGDFPQLSSMDDNTLYILLIASKALVAVIAKKVAYNAFTKTVVLIKVIWQQSDLSSKY